MANGIVIPTKDTVKSITPTVDATKVTSGSIDVAKCGKIVQVYVRNVKFNANGQSVVIATGLPTAALQQGVVFSNVDISDNDSVWIGNNGTTLVANINSYNVAHWGGMTYITTDD